MALNCKIPAQPQPARLDRTRYGALLGLLLLVAGVFSNVNAEADNTRVLLVFGDSLSAAYRMEERDGWVARLQPVSYTHLTLPTIYSV